LPSLAGDADLLGTISTGEESHPANRAIAEIGEWVWSGRNGEKLQRICLASLGGRPADAAFATIALSRRLASGGNRVVLVDIARDPRQIGKILGLPEGPGLSEFLAGQPDIESLVSTDSASGLRILRIGGDRALVNRAILEQRLDKVLSELAASYDSILIHGGEADGWAAAIARKSDGAIILAAPARMQDAAAAVASLTRGGVKKAGIVELQPQFGRAAIDEAPPLAANS
jgi:tyrosine-protein kinase Etk/Wzc